MSPIVTFLSRVEYMRNIQKKYEALRRAGQHAGATSLYADLKRVQSDVDNMIPEMKQLIEVMNMPKLF